MKYSFNGRDRLSGWFGLSYASWLTLPRVLLQEMPDEWQDRMAALLEEFEETFMAHDLEFGTRVQVTKNGKFMKTPDWLTNYRHPDRMMIEGLLASNEET